MLGGGSVRFCRKQVDSDRTRLALKRQVPDPKRLAEYNVTVSRKVSVAGGSKSLASKLTELRPVLCYEAETWPVPSRSCPPDLTPHETREM